MTGSQKTDKTLQIEIIELLEKNCRTDTETIAAITGISRAKVEEIIKQSENEGIIKGYSAVIDPDKFKGSKVTALIEVKVTPQRGEGFDRVARRIYGFPQVKDCYLISGGFDLAVMIEGSDMKEVALFVAEKLAPLECVLSTSTHFVLKKYKNMGVIFEEKQKDDREVIIL